MARRRNQRDRGRIIDRKTGVLQAHSNPRLQPLLTAIPLHAPEHEGAQLPCLNLPWDYTNVIAIHLQNLYPNLPLPSQEPQTVTLEGSKYRLVNPTGDDKPMGGNGELWLPWCEDAESVGVDAVMADPVDVPDVNELSDAQLTALEQHIEQRRADEARAAELDQGHDPQAEEWMRYRADRLQELADQQRAALDGQQGGDQE